MGINKAKSLGLEKNKLNQQSQEWNNDSVVKGPCSTIMNLVPRTHIARRVYQYLSISMIKHHHLSDIRKKPFPLAYDSREGEVIMRGGDSRS